MPYGNGTGPAGMGPMTGRGAGFCAGYAVPGFANRGPGWGGGRGGRGFRNMYWATGRTGWQRAMAAPPGSYVPPVPYAPYQPTTEQELEALRGQVKFMEDSVRQAEERIRELEQQKGKE